MHLETDSATGGVELAGSGIGGIPDSLKVGNNHLCCRFREWGVSRLASRLGTAQNRKRMVGKRMTRDQV